MTIAELIAAIGPKIRAIAVKVHKANELRMEAEDLIAGRDEITGEIDTGLDPMGYPSENDRDELIACRNETDWEARATLHARAKLITEIKTEADEITNQIADFIKEATSALVRAKGTHFK